MYLIYWLNISLYCPSNKLFFTSFIFSLFFKRNDLKKKWQKLNRTQINRTSVHVTRDKNKKKHHGRSSKRGKTTTVSTKKKMMKKKKKKKGNWHFSAPEQQPYACHWCKSVASSQTSQEHIILRNDQQCKFKFCYIKYYLDHSKQR